MDGAHTLLIVIGGGGALIAGMAGLLKVMVLARLDSIQATLSGLSRDLHRLDLRVTRLEAEHHIRTCMAPEQCHEIEEAS